MAGLVSVPGLPQDQGTLRSRFSHLHNRPVYKLMKNLKAGWGMLSSGLTVHSAGFRKRLALSPTGGV